MDARQLEYFVTVAEELSFTRAARRLFTVQSTVSMAIRALETDLKATLFDRSTRRVALSPAGSALLPEAKAALAALERARNVVQEASTGLRGRLRVGTMTSVGLVDLPDLFGAFHERYPLVDVHLAASPTGSTGLADDLRHGRLDVALLALPHEDLDGLEARPLLTAPYSALLSPEHRLAGRESVTLAELANERFVDLPQGFGNRVTVDRAFHAAGTPRRVAIEVPDRTAVPAYVKAGLGIALLPSIGPDDPDVVVVPLAGTTLTWTLSVATLAGLRPAPAVRALLDLVKYVADAAKAEPGVTPAAVRT
ncbi:DNA-binding transcriptional regulator, LysR family [Amycolatopsis xylanica]|uniref:DNA-binding transcriptional regulator, LysR family n=1 Tax=Amycolatopsis xylanica TaxID=589385 RepID=A0A1H3NP82_9PSEU|nr:LysR family transcriptional regulator [Amycolatopsis xylanica]SDY90712.1 DNA-binding transcriptional regulator, LysR family [Amycolatopsis xylanica]